jgi:hypothetical protein
MMAMHKTQDFKTSRLFETGAEKLIFPMGWEQRRQRNEE